MTPPSAPKTIGSMNGTWAKWFKLVLATTPLIWGSATAFGKYAVTSLHDLDTRVTKIEESRFTNADGRELAVDVATIKAEIRNLTKLEGRLERLEGKLDSIIERLPVRTGP